MVTTSQIWLLTNHRTRQSEGPKKEFSRQVPGLPSIWGMKERKARNYLLLFNHIFTHTAYMTVGDNTGPRSGTRNQFPYNISSSCLSSSLLSRPTFPQHLTLFSLQLKHAFQTARQFCICRHNNFTLLPFGRPIPTQRFPNLAPTARGPWFSKFAKLEEHPFAS